MVKNGRRKRAIFGAVVVLLLLTIINASPAAAANSAATVVVRAKGSIAGGIGPEMVVRVNGVIASPAVVEVTNESFEDFTFTTNNMTAEPLIDVVFVNDAYAPPEDRNLFIESITLAGTTYPSTGPGAIIDRGSGDAAFDGIDTIPGQPTVWWNAALRFQIETPPGTTEQLTVRAKGSIAGGIGPEMVVRVNGVIASPAVVEVTNESFEDFTFTTNNMTAEPLIDVVFVNDGVAGGRDRNLFVDSIVVTGLLIESDDDRVTLDKGSGDAAFDGIDTGPGRFSLYVNASLRYEARAVPIPPAPEPRPPLDGELIYSQDFGSGVLDTENWAVYDEIGNAGWGLRRPEAFSIVELGGAQGGRVLKVTAQMGVGENEGLLVSGGMALQSKTQTYGRYSIRVRTERDPDRVTTGVVLLWPDSGLWPEDGEIDWYEAWRDRYTRSPVELVTHYVIDGVHDADEVKLRDPDGSLTDGSEWHTYTLDWRPDYLAVSVDGGEPNIVSTDSAKIPQQGMNMTVQLDAWEPPYGPGQQPTISAPLSMWVDWITVERYPSLQP